jgi:type IX secretion system PorP/SprF family membrane protein
MKRLIITLAIIGCMIRTEAQQVPLVNHSYVNPYLANPAYAGNNGTNLFLLNRLQWVDVEGAPETFIATMDGKVGNSNLGYGLMLMNDVSNIIGKTGVFGTYAYHLGLNENSHISFGLSVGFEQNKILFDRINATNPVEIALINNIESQSNFDANAGLAFTSSAFTVGVSSYQLFANRNRFSDEQNQVDYVYSFMRHYALNARYRITLEEDKVYLDPNVLVRYAQGTQPQVDAGLQLNFANTAWLGGGFRTNYGAQFMAGGVLGSKLLGSYSYGRSVGPIERLSSNSHEFTIGYLFNGVNDSKDSDGDGVIDALDKEPNTPEGCEVDAQGVGLDSDYDRIPNCIDQELNTPYGAPVDPHGVALDDDQDGVINLYDREPGTPKGCPVDKLGVSTDKDMDGVSDCADLELNTPLGAKVDRFGVAMDSDNDGVVDLYDREPNTEHAKHLGVSNADASDCIVDKHGVALDSDKDGVTDCVDEEPNTPLGVFVDARGKALDTDGDGISDGIDREINSPKGAKVDQWGIALPNKETMDDDGDGVPNALDLEPNTPPHSVVDANGRAYNPITVNRLEIKDMEDGSDEWDYYMVVGVFKIKSNVRGYQAQLQTKYGIKTNVLVTKAGYNYVYTKIVTTKDEAYAEVERLVGKNIEDFIVGNPWLWKEAKDQ